MNGVQWVFEQGGWVSYALAAVSIFLWSAVVRRALLLRAPQPTSAQTTERRCGAIASFNQAAKKLQGSPVRLQRLVERTRIELQTMRGFISTLVAVAPLLGLLGTVIGMVEMFGSLQGTLSSSGESTVAGGISTALVTTQLGLVIAAPGFIASYLLGRQQVRRERDLDAALRSIEGPEL